MFYVRLYADNRKRALETADNLLTLLIDELLTTRRKKKHTHGAGFAVQDSCDATLARCVR